MLAHSWMGSLPSGGPAGSRLGFGALGGIHPLAAAWLLVPDLQQLLWITSGLGGVQLHVFYPPSWMWVSGSGSESWVLLYGSSAWAYFQSESNPEKKKLL